MLCSSCVCWRIISNLKVTSSLRASRNKLVAIKKVLSVIAFDFCDKKWHFYFPCRLRYDRNRPTVILANNKPQQSIWLSNWTIADTWQLLTQQRMERFYFFFVTVRFSPFLRLAELPFCTGVWADNFTESRFRRDWP